MASLGDSLLAACNPFPCCQHATPFKDCDWPPSKGRLKGVFVLPILPLYIASQIPCVLRPFWRSHWGEWDSISIRPRPCPSSTDHGRWVSTGISRVLQLLCPRDVSEIGTIIGQHSSTCPSIYMECCTIVDIQPMSPPVLIRFCLD